MTHPQIILKILLINFLPLTFLFSFENNDKLAMRFYDEKKFQLGIIEYERLKLNSNDTKLNIFYQTQIAHGYKELGLVIESINEYKKVLELDLLNFNSVIEIILLYQENFYFYEAKAFIELQKINFKNKNLDEILYLQSINYFALKNNNNALEILEKLKIDKLKKEGILIVKNNINKKKISPEKASFYNLIIPGLGYYYISLPQTALATFFAEAIFAYGTIQTYKNGYTIGSILGGTLFSGFYLGSIYGANQQAHKKNNLLMKKDIFKMINIYKSN